jgi:hypothetical protein
MTVRQFEGKVFDQAEIDAMRRDPSIPGASDLEERGKRRKGTA